METGEDGGTKGVKEKGDYSGKDPVDVAQGNIDNNFSGYYEVFSNTPAGNLNQLVVDGKINKSSYAALVHMDQMIYAEYGVYQTFFS